MKYLVLTLLLVPTLLFCLFPSWVWSTDFPGQWSGEVGAQYRFFPDAGIYGNSEKHHGSIYLQPEYFRPWNHDRSVLNVKAFTRFDEQDDERRHRDLRELSWVSSWASLELRVGVSKVFWGGVRKANIWWM